MNKKTNKKSLVVPSLTGSANLQENDELKPNSSCHQMERSTRKRTKNNVDFPTEEPTLKRGRFDSGGSTNPKISEEVELNSSKSFPTHKQITADDLPPEMIEAILKHLATEDLLRSRQVNRKWNKLSSHILRHRDDMELTFDFKRGQFVNSKSKSLKQLVQCFRKSTLFFAHFNFGDLMYFGYEDINNFFAIEGKLIRSLEITMTDSQNDVQTLRKLLLEQVPNLKKLKINFKFRSGSSSTVQLFDSNKFQLPKLEVLVVVDRCRSYRTITGDILTAACNLKRLDVTDNVTVEDLIFLQSLNKLHCLKTFKVCLSENLIGYWSNSSKTMNLQLESLHLSFGNIWENKHLKLGATAVINQLLKSSKDVIRTLAVEPIGLLPGVAFPKLKKLYKLEIHPGLTNCEIFPPLLDMADIFPNLKELDMHVACTTHFFPSPQLMSSVEVLRIFDNNSISSKEKLTKMVPNVKTLFLRLRHSSSYRGEQGPFVKGIRAIFNNLTKLEKLEWEITESSYRNLKFSLDAAVTGLTEEFCKENSVKFQKKKKLSSNQLASVEAQRKHPSILDLKDLKKLYIKFFFGIRETCLVCGSDCGDTDSDDNWNKEEKDDAGFTEKSRFFKTGFTKVSQFLAFQLITNLDVRITRHLV